MKVQLKSIFILFTLQRISLAYGQRPLSLCKVKEDCIHKRICREKGYQSNEPPRKNFTRIYLEVGHLKIIKIQQRENTIKIYVLQTLSWLDHRITLDPINVDGFHSHNPMGVNGMDKERPYDLLSETNCPIWYPNITQKDRVLQRGKPSHPFKYMTFTAGEAISTAGEGRNYTSISMGQEYILELLCDLNVDEFPFDTHKCNATGLNEGTTALELLLGNTGNKTVAKSIYETGFYITVTWHGAVISGKTSYVKFDLKLTRILSTFIFQYYLPCIAIVCVSQVSFIIPPSFAPGRIGLLATLFLTLTNLFIHHMVNNGHIQLPSAILLNGYPFDRS